MKNSSQTLYAIVFVTLIVIIGLFVFLFNRKPDTSPPPSVPASSDQSVNRTAQRAFVNFTSVFQAEDFDIGGPDVSFHIDQKDGNDKDKYRTDGANIYPITKGSGDYFVGNLKSGDWLQYTVVVATDGKYALKAHAAGAGTETIYAIELNGKSIGQFKVPMSNAKDHSFETVTSTPFDLPTGQHTLKIELTGGTQEGGGGLDWFQGVKAGALEPQPGDPMDNK